MSSTEAALRAAIKSAIREVGIETFKATSVFMSSHRRDEIKLAA